MTSIDPSHPLLRARHCRQSESRELARKSKHIIQGLSSLQINLRMYSQKLRVVYQTKKGTLDKALTLPTLACDTEKHYVKILSLLKDKQKI